MAHMMKHTRAGCGHMFAHYDRQAEHIGNENVDRERTYLNYNLATHQQMEQGEFVRKRCSEVHCQNRKDVNVMVSWVVTAPKDLPETEYKQFFQASYDFLKSGTAWKTWYLRGFTWMRSNLTCTLPLSRW